MNPLVEALKYFAIIMAELTVLFIAISALVALALMYLPPNKLRDWMSGKGILGNIIGVLFGAVTPFCACSTVPITVGLLQAGVPFGTVTSLVIASPLLDPLVFTMLAAFMGLDVAVGFLALTSVAAVVFGVILDKAGDASQVKRVRVKGGGHDLSEEAPSGFATRLKLSLLKAWVDFRSVVVYMVVGVAIGASIYGYLPEDLLASVAGRDNPFAVLAVALIGMPLYIRVESALLIGLALLDKGASMGAVMALIISGAGIAILEITMFAGIFKRPLIMAFLVIVFVMAAASGLIFSAVL